MSLQALRDLLADPKRFTTGTFARDAEGRPVGPNHEKAVCWCLVGALRKLEPDWRPGSHVYRVISGALGDIAVADWADENGHKAVIDLLDRLINESKAA